MIVRVACGADHTCAVTSAGSIFTFGRYIATGHGEDCFVRKPALLQNISSKGVVSVSAHYSHTTWVTKAGEVFTWGYGDCGRLGHHAGDETNQQTPKRVEALVGVKAKELSCGYDHIAVYTEDGHMYTFGWGEYGQLGHGDRETKYSPQLVHALQGGNITQVQCGNVHTMALTSVRRNRSSWS